MKKAALLSVSNREGIGDFARSLQEEGYVLLTSSGTGKHLADEGIETVSIEEYTGQKEILDGRVKTLHPRIHAGLLAKLDNPQHVQELEENGIFSIEVAAVNLYPFVEHVSSDSANDPARMVELVDIGGPTMIRAAAKNFSSVYAVIDPTDYSTVLDAIRKNDSTEAFRCRLRLASKVFTAVADYNLQISKYFSSVEVAAEGVLTTDRSPEQGPGEIEGMVAQLGQELRYGENPHQKAGFYCSGNTSPFWKQLNGKALSYNNLLDFDAGFRLVQSLTGKGPAVCILKHLNPCGVAYAEDLTEALRKARAGDPRSHFGGIIALNQSVSVEVAQAIIEDFTEIVLAPSYSAEALDILKKKKNLRVLEVDLAKRDHQEFRSITGGLLVQERDSGASEIERAERMSGQDLSNAGMQDLQLAWDVCAHVKSNAITLVRDQMLICSGGGQMSRIDALEVALAKARTHGHDLNGAACASDAFFPFTDCLELLSESGVKSVIAPGGSRADTEVVATAQEKGITLFFAPDRHFRH